ncbi:MAG: hypothetical protein ACKO6L_07995, partial [Flavobacteriales bacterium]
LRHTIDDDALWWSTIKYVSDTAFKITSVDYEQLVQVFEKKSGQTLRPIFEQFVKYAALPVLEYELCGRKKDKIKYHWKSPVRGFNMPAILITNRGRKRIYPTTEWQEFNLESEIFQGWDDQAFYFLQKQK